MASLVAHKGHQYLLAAAARILTTVPQPHFLMIGDGPLRKELKDMAKNLGLHEHVTFSGERADIADLLAMSEVVVLPSTQRE